MLVDMRNRVEDTAQTPMPPVAIARVDAGVAITKAQDNRLPVDTKLLTVEQIAAGLAKMSKGDQTLAMIKASYAAGPSIAVDPNGRMRAVAR